MINTYLYKYLNYYYRCTKHLHCLCFQKQRKRAECLGRTGSLCLSDIQSWTFLASFQWLLCQRKKLFHFNVCTKRFATVTAVLFREAVTCGRQRRGCSVRAVEVPEAGEFLYHSPNVNILESYQPCQWPVQSSTEIYTHSFSRDTNSLWFYFVLYSPSHFV